MLKWPFRYLEMAISIIISILVWLHHLTLNTLVNKTDMKTNRVSFMRICEAKFTGNLTETQGTPGTRSCCSGITCLTLNFYTKCMKI